MLERFGDDRVFVSLELAGDEPATDTLADRLVSDGHPLVRYRIDDITGLGGELYRWEFAVAVAGAIMGVHPFDQPDVQKAKDLTDEALTRFESLGEAPQSASRAVGPGSDRRHATRRLPWLSSLTSSRLPTWMLHSPV